MRLDDHFDDYEEYEDYDEEQFDKRRGRSQVRSAAIVIVLFVGILAAVILLAVGKGKGSSLGSNGTRAENAYAKQNEVRQGVNEVLTGSNLTAQDLDFWHDYDTDVRPALMVSDDTAEKAPPAEENVSENAAVSENELPKDPSNDGKHTKISGSDGSEIWVDINPYLAKNNYDFSGLVYKTPFMQYYENNTRKSYIGVDISKDEDFVDFKKLKKAGVDYCMLRLGQRGYATGDITLDDYFLDNYARAKEAELDVGVYFVTSAVTLEEGKEEADFCIRTLSENEIQLDYPIALSTMKLGEGRSRTDALEKMPRTNIALTFLKAVEDAGYFSLLYGDKATLIQKYSLGSMVGYDVWYSEEADIPDYPYKFVMWQYDLGGTVDGIAGGARLNICFTDYSVR